jgi:hypothetical protein
MFPPRRATDRTFVSAATVAAAFAAGALTLPRTASGAPKFQGVGETWVGYTDNAQSAPDVPLPGGTPRSGGAIALLRPGIVFAIASPRTVQRLQYTYSYNLFLQSTNASTSSNQLDYQGFFDLSPRAELVVGATAIQSNQSSAILLVPPGAGAVDALPPGSGAFLAATTNEVLSIDLAPEWRSYEMASASAQTPIFDTVAPRTLAPGARAGIERRFERDALGVEARGDYSVIEGSLAPDGSALGAQQQIVGTGVVVWRRDWGLSFTSRAEAGVMRVQRFNTGRGFWGPAGAASLAYFTERGVAELAYDHAVATNPYLGQTLLIDEARFRGALPLTKRGEWMAAASAGYQSARILDQNTNFAAHVDAILADAGIGWQIAPWLLVGIRYQHVEQISDARAPPLPVSFVRNSILIGATVKFPSDLEMPQVYRAPRRVDRTDEIRGPVEPAEGGVPGNRDLAK